MQISPALAALPYAERQRQIRAANIAAYQPEADTLDAVDAAALQDNAPAVDADALADAVRAVLARRYARRSVDAGNVRADAMLRLPALLAAGHTPADAAALAMFRADRRAVSAWLRSKERAAGIGTVGGEDAPEDADALALALAAVEDDPGAEWLPVAPEPRPDTLRIVPPLSPEDAHALALDALPPRGRRTLAATLEANEGADPAALTHRATCRKPNENTARCCRRDAIKPALRTSVVALAMTGSNSGPARTATKREQVEYGTDYLQHASTARRARTEADAQAHDERAEAQRDRRTLLPHRARWAGPAQPEAEQPAPRTRLAWFGDRPLPADAVALAAHRQQVRSVGNGNETPRREGTRLADLPEWAVMPDTRATGSTVMPDPDDLRGETRTGQTVGYDLSKSEQQAADRAAASERQEAGMARGNDASKTGTAQPGGEADAIGYGYGRPDKVTAEDGALQAYAHKTEQPSAEKAVSAGGAGVAPTLARVTPSAEARWSEQRTIFDAQED